MNYTAIIAARMGSRRCPGKQLLPILGRPMLERMVERIRYSDRIGRIVIATSDLLRDDILEEWARSMRVDCFRGSPDDVLGRIVAAAEAFDAELIAELLGDNPLVHSDLIEDVIDFFEKGGFDFASNATAEYPHTPPDCRCFPIGIRVQVFPLEVIARSAQLTDDPRHREHSTTLIAERPDLFKLGYMEAAGRWTELARPNLTFAVNHRENYELVRAIFESCYPNSPNFDLCEVVRTFDAHSELAPLMGPQPRPSP